MAIYYTCTEGGEIKKMPHTAKHSKVIKQLKKRRVVDWETGVSLSNIFGITVQSVFFTKNRKVKKVWDSYLYGYRAKIYYGRI